MPTSLPSATVVVVNYNTKDHLPGCLDALLALDYAGGVQIIVVDNASVDGSAKLVRTRYPQVQLIASDANLGFAGGANRGWIAAGGDVLAVVNPDVRPRREWLATLAGALADHAAEGAAIVGSKLLYNDGRTVQHAGGVFGFPLATTDHPGRGSADTAGQSTPAPVVYVAGGALMITRAAYEALGGFDPGFYPVYFEDVDLCWRARAAGYTVWYVPEAVALHQESANIARDSALYFQYFHRSRLRFVLKHYALPDLVWGFAPAEAARLRAHLPDLDRAASLDLYSDPAGLADLLASLGVDGSPLPADLQADAGPPDPGPQARREQLAGAVAEVLALWRLGDPDGAGGAPARPMWRKLRDEWYVPAVRGHQIQFNAAVARAVRDLAAQVGGLEAAALTGAAVESAAVARELAVLRAEVAALQAQLAALDDGKRETGAVKRET